MLTVQQKKNRLQKCKRLISRHAGESVKSILFTDEKIFNVEAAFNKQNDRIYARSSSEIPKNLKRMYRSHHPASVMVWAGASWLGKAPLHFVEKGVKVSAKNYMDNVLVGVVEPLNHDLFNGGHWTFQQDSAPAHKAKIVQKWLREKVPDFISTEEWPAASPDLNPLDYSIWSKLQADVCSKPHKSLEALKKALKKAWDNFPMESVRAAVDDWIPRLKACVKARGSHFEK